MSEASVHRLPVTMRTVFQDLLLVTYEVAPQRLAELLPPVIHPYVRDGRSYVSIVVGNLRGMRPAPLPEFLGVNYYQIVYRAVVRLRRADGTELPGVFFLRSDGNDPLMSLFGNRLSEFRFHFFHTGALSLYRRRDELLVAAETSDGAGDLVLHARDLGPAEARPCAPGFLDVDDEKRTLVQLFHAYAYDAPRGCVYDLAIERGEWQVRRLELLDHFSAFFGERSFDHSTAKPVAAVHIEECAYVWKPMVAIDERNLVPREQ